MTKPKKDRHVMHPPFVVFFKPQGIPLFQLEQVTLTVDEYEAIRLADNEKLKHDKAAQKMKISRPTFTRLLESAHNKISDALVNGKAIRIEGGHFILSHNRFICNNCHHIWTIKHGDKLPTVCPLCGSHSIVDLSLQCGYNKPWGGARKRWRHRGGHF